MFDPSNPSLAPASLLGLFSCWPLLAALKLRRSSAAVATNREDHRSPRKARKSGTHDGTGNGYRPLGLDPNRVDKSGVGFTAQGSIAVFWTSRCSRRRFAPASAHTRLSLKAANHSLRKEGILGLPQTGQFGARGWFLGGEHAGQKAPTERGFSCRWRNTRPVGSGPPGQTTTMRVVTAPRQSKQRRQFQVLW